MHLVHTFLQIGFSLFTVETWQKIKAVEDKLGRAHLRFFTPT